MVHIAAKLRVLIVGLLCTCAAAAVHGEASSRIVKPLELSMAQGSSLEVRYDRIVANVEQAAGTARVEELLVRPGRHGTVRLRSESIVFTPEEGFLGQAILQFSLRDDDGSFVAKVYIEVKPTSSTVASEGEKERDEN